MLKIQFWKEAFDYYSNLFSGAVSALQNAEIANMEAKYDAEIAAAQGNAQEVERLETEKAQKKLEIEKKYADVQFAVKSQPDHCRHGRGHHESALATGTDRRTGGGSTDGSNRSRPAGRGQC